MLPWPSALAGSSTLMLAELAQPKRLRGLASQQAQGIFNSQQRDVRSKTYGWAAVPSGKESWGYEDWQQ